MRHTTPSHPRPIRSDRADGTTPPPLAYRRDWIRIDRDGYAGWRTRSTWTDSAAVQAAAARYGVTPIPLRAPGRRRWVLYAPGTRRPPSSPPPLTLVPPAAGGADGGRWPVEIVGMELTGFSLVRRPDGSTGWEPEGTINLVRSPDGRTLTPLDWLALHDAATTAPTVPTAPTAAHEKGDPT